MKIHFLKRDLNFLKFRLIKMSRMVENRARILSPVQPVWKIISLTIYLYHQEMCSVRGSLPKSPNVGHTGIG